MQWQLGGRTSEQRIAIGDRPVPDREMYRENQLQGRTRFRLPPAGLCTERLLTTHTACKSPLRPASDKPPGRTNFLNYNYCFCRCFQLMKVEQFSMFFPLINIKSPLLAPGSGTTWGLGRALAPRGRASHHA